MKFICHMQYLVREISQKQRTKPLEIRGCSLGDIFGSQGTRNLLSQEQQSLIHSVSTLVQFDKGENTIFLEGEAGAFVYVISSGLVRISRCGFSGRRQVLSLKLPGDVFGYPENGLYLNSATAIGKTTLYRISWERLQELMRMDPQLQSNVLVRVAFDLRQAQKRILVLGQQNISQRLASFLLELMEHADFYKPDLRQLFLPLSRFDLGDYLGTAPETVVRVLSKMEKSGIIHRLSSRVLLIPSQQNLAEMLQGRRRND